MMGVQPNDGKLRVVLAESSPQDLKEGDSRPEKPQAGQHLRSRRAQDQSPLQQ